MVTAVVGAQTGSEGKGLIVGHIARDYQVHIRVGAANAGHTVYVRGQKHVLQQLPCAAYCNPLAKLVLGAGAMISAEILDQEINDNVAWRELRGLPPLDLTIDFRAHMIMPWHIETENNSDLAERIGSTSATAKEGIGAAQAARAMRTGYGLAKDVILKLPSSHPSIIAHAKFDDTVSLLHDAITMDTKILLEGTQGTDLSNITGFYPYVTSRNTTAAGLIADCGIGPKAVDHIIIVARTFPIRVAGNSGPFWPDSKEINWADIGVNEEDERTTVTKKVRRVATFSMDQIKHSARINTATDIALTFADYLSPEIAGKFGGMPSDMIDKYDYIGPLIEDIEAVTMLPVRYIGTGPKTVVDRYRYPMRRSVRA